MGELGYEKPAIRSRRDDQEGVGHIGERQHDG